MGASAASGGVAAPAEAIASSRSARLRLLWVVLLLELTLLAWLVRRDPVMLYGFWSFPGVKAHHPAASDAPFKRDPGLGTPLPTDAVGMAIRQAAGRVRAGCLLVPVGDCASCIKADLPAWQRECRRRGIAMVLLSSATDGGARRFRKRLGLTVPYVRDPTESMERHLNVLWYGRGYYYSSSWRLRWLPRRIGADTPFADSGFLAVLEKGRP